MWTWTIRWDDEYVGEGVPVVTKNTNPWRCVCCFEKGMYCACE